MLPDGAGAVISQTKVLCLGWANKLYRKGDQVNLPVKRRTHADILSVAGIDNFPP